MEPVDRIRELLELMKQNDLAELEVEAADLRIKIRKNEPVHAFPAGLTLTHMPVAQAPAGNPGPAAAAQETAPARQPGLIEITSPMVGTFYRSPSPGAAPYTSVGSEVEPDMVVCIIEAMKVMNEIKAEVTGKVTEILVQDGEPIEFGQVLFLVEPAIA